MTDIVITGYRHTNTAGVQVTSFNYNYGNSSGDVVAYSISENANPEAVNVNVNVRVSDATHEEKAKEAAQNIAEALAKIIDAGQRLPTNTPIQLPNGQFISVGDLLTDLKNTKFLVTDSPNLGNNGVGKADRPTMTDTLYYGEFAEGTGQNSYSNAGWNGQGIIAVVLHEIAHISAGGFANFNAEVNRFNTEMAARKIPIPQRDFYGSYGEDYSFDNESYAQHYATSAASTLGLDIGLVTTAFQNDGLAGDFRGADTVYQEHQGMYGF